MVASVFKRFRDLDMKTIPKVMTDEECSRIRISQDKLEKMPDLKVIFSIVSTVEL